MNVERRWLGTSVGQVRILAAGLVLLGLILVINIVARGVLARGVSISRS